MHLEPLSRRSFLALTAMAVAQTALRPDFGQSQDFAHSTLKEASKLVRRTTVVIADDNEFLRDCLRRLLEREADIEVVGEATYGAEAVKLARELKPDILTTCKVKPDMSAFDVLRELRATPVRVILWTAHTLKIDVLTALKLGARGYVFKPEKPQVLLKAIRTVMAGGYWVRREPVPNVEQYLRTLMQSMHEEGQKKFGLTARELEIVSAMVAGTAGKELAEYFKIGESTMKRHVSNIFDKLGVSSRMELALFAVNHGLPLKGIE